VSIRSQAAHAPQIDAPPELRLEKLLNAREGEEPDVTLRIQVQDNVNVGFRDVVAARNRAEKQGVTNTLGFECGPEFTKAREHEIARSVVWGQALLVHLFQFEKRGRVLLGFFAASTGSVLVEARRV